MLRIAALALLVACRPPAPPPISAHTEGADGLFAEVRVACVHYPAERGWYEGGILRRTSVGLEVTTVFRARDEQLIVRDYTPVLAIGDHPATASAWTAQNTATWRFYDPSALAIGDPIRYGFPHSPRDIGRLSADCR